MRLTGSTARTGAARPAAPGDEAAPEKAAPEKAAPEKAARRDAPRANAMRVETRDGWPVRFEWCGRRYRVASIEAVWCIEGRWWLDALRCGLRRRYYRLLAWPEAQDGWRVRPHLPLCLEIYRQGRQWRVWRVAD